MILSSIAELTPAFHAESPSGTLSLALRSVCLHGISKYSHLQGRRIRLPFWKGGGSGSWTCETFGDSYMIGGIAHKIMSASATFEDSHMLESGIAHTTISSTSMSRCLWAISAIPCVCELQQFYTDLYSVVLVCHTPPANWITGVKLI